MDHDSDSDANAPMGSSVPNPDQVTVPEDKLSTFFLKFRSCSRFYGQGQVFASVELEIS